MTKKKPSPQNRIWEKERRERLNKTFDNLSKLLPEYEPATTFSKIDILQKSIQFIEKLQEKIKEFLDGKDVVLKKHVDELEERLDGLLSRNSDLADLLKKSKINIPPSKYDKSSDNDESEAQDEKKEIIKETKKKKVVKKDESKKIETPQMDVIGVTTPTTTTTEIVEPVVPIFATEATIELDKALITTPEEDCPTPTEASIPNTCLVVANNQVVGTLQKTNNVNVTSALLSTPIMTTSVLISNNGNLVQMPIVQQPSSLLIVSNNDVNEKIKCKKSTKRKHNLNIKSIEVIPGNIVNGKIPIPALKKTSEIKKKTKTKRKRKVSSKEGEIEESDAKKMKADETLVENKKEEHINETEIKITEQIKENDSSKKVIEQLEEAMHLEQSDLSNDIFEALQVNDNVVTNQESLSPTAAYLMNFPLVAGGKVTGNHDESCSEEDDDPDSDKKGSNLNDNNMILDNFSSFLNSNLYSNLDNVTQINPVASTNYSTIYQSIDNMIENKQIVPKHKDKYPTTEFTFTLTSTVSTSTNTLSTFDYRNSSNYLYPNVSNAPPKPPIMTDFTFSLTSTTTTLPKTVQSHYTNSTTYDSTNYYNQNNKYTNYNYNSTFPSYETPNENKMKNYNLPTEQPATNFTFSLTSSTKTLPKYTSSNKPSCLKLEDELLKTPTKKTNAQCNSLSLNPLKTPPKQKSNIPTSQFSSTSKYDVNWMTSQDYKSSNTPDYPMLPPLDFTTPTSSFYTNFDLNRKSDIYFAHPPGEDNLTWSPNKITNILNDTTSHLSSNHYFPTTLPNLNGDLALHTVNTTINQMSKPKKAVNQETNFLSVRQLVDHDKTKTIPCNNPQQKPFNNNYSAESLISSSGGSGSINKKDNYYNYSTTVDNPSLSFNFDYNNYNNNYNANQTFVTSFLDNNYTSGQQSYYTSPNTTGANKTQNQYYQHHDAPYYLPDKKMAQSYNSNNSNNNSSNLNNITSNKIKKSHKTNYDFPPPPPPPSTAGSSGYFPTPLSINTPMLPPTEETYSYHNINYLKNPDKSTTSLGNNVNAIHLGHFIGNNATNISNTGNSLANFNLSTICPEINDKAVVRQHANHNNW